MTGACTGGLSSYFLALSTMSERSRANEPHDYNAERYDEINISLCDRGRDRSGALRLPFSRSQSLT